MLYLCLLWYSRIIKIFQLFQEESSPFQTQLFTYTQIFMYICTNFCKFHLITSMGYLHFFLILIINHITNSTSYLSSIVVTLITLCSLHWCGRRSGAWTQLSSLCMLICNCLISNLSFQCCCSDELTRYTLPVFRAWLGYHKREPRKILPLT